jgi:hypothetical protein
MLSNHRLHSFMSIIEVFVISQFHLTKPHIFFKDLSNHLNHWLFLLTAEKGYYLSSDLFISIIPISALYKKFRYKI